MTNDTVIDAGMDLAAWRSNSPAQRIRSFQELPRELADDFFLSLTAREQAELVIGLPQGERRLWMRLLAPDDAADVIQQAAADEREYLLSVLDESTRREVTALLAYAEDDAGGLMSPRFARVRPEMTVDEAIAYLRRQASSVETIYYTYALDADQRLLGVVSFRDLFSADRNKKVQDVMRTRFVSVPENMDQEGVAKVIAEHHLLAVPVVDPEGHMRGIVTVDEWSMW